jgi:hypothetical protein
MYPKPVLYTATFEGGPLGGFQFSVEQGQKVLTSVEILEGVARKHFYELDENTSTFVYKGSKLLVEMYQ